MADAPIVASRHLTGTAATISVTWTDEYGEPAAAAGAVTVRVQKADWTSPAGRIVEACLNVAAAKWKFDTSFGKPGAHITQVQFK